MCTTSYILGWFQTRVACCGPSLHNKIVFLYPFFFTFSFEVAFDWGRICSCRVGNLRRKKKIVDNLKSQLLGRLREALCFGLLFDETTDIRYEAQLIAYCCFPDVQEKGLQSTIFSAWQEEFKPQEMHFLWCWRNSYKRQAWIGPNALLWLLTELPQWLGLSKEQSHGSKAYLPTVFQYAVSVIDKYWLLRGYLCLCTKDKRAEKNYL